MPATPRFRVSTTLKNYVLRQPGFMPMIREYGFDSMTDPEIIAEGLYATLPQAKFAELLDKAVGHKPEQRAMAKEVFGV